MNQFYIKYLGLLYKLYIVLCKGFRIFFMGNLFKIRLSFENIQNKIESLFRIKLKLFGYFWNEVFVGILYIFI